VQHHKTDSKQSSEVEMSKEQDPNQIDSEEVTSISESDETTPSASEPYVDQEMADAYGFTPQQAKAMSLYL
jgi:hypothetical protein